MAKAGSTKKVKRRGHPANMFILFFLAYWRKCGGNIYQVARCCGQRWKTLPQSEKEKYRRIYCSRAKNSRTCKRASAGGGGGGSSSSGKSSGGGSSPRKNGGSGGGGGGGKNRGGSTKSGGGKKC
ncbi:unnamed protein product [Orchesella dallaii]|uniref:HMG box domain-containing protein n=1 Tax=Orchesella dallaii TaxID=48710 RepID=A0ABP1QKG1_9HEXA